MNPGRRATIRVAVLASSGVFLVFLAIAGVGLWKARRACHTFQAFSDELQHGNWAGARAMLDTNPSLLRIENGSVVYCDCDMTAQILRLRPLPANTFSHYFTHKGYGHSVFVGIDNAEWGYAELQDGKIKHLKLY